MNYAVTNNDSIIVYMQHEQHAEHWKHSIWLLLYWKNVSKIKIKYLLFSFLSSENLHVIQTPPPPPPPPLVEDRDLFIPHNYRMAAYVSDFVTGRPCDVWGHELTTCPM